MIVKIGVVNAVPAVPVTPVLDVYQTTFPDIQVADNEAVVLLQMLKFAEGVVFVGGAGAAFTSTVFEVIVLPLLQFVVSHAA